MLCQIHFASSHIFRLLGSSIPVSNSFNEFSATHSASEVELLVAVFSGEGCEARATAMPESDARLNAQERDPG